MKPITRFNTSSAGRRSDAIGSIESFLMTAIGDMAPTGASAGSPARGRPRVLPSMCLWSGLLVCVLRGFSSQLGLWRLLTATQLWFYPRFSVSDQAVYKRLQQEGIAPLQNLFEQITCVLAERLAPYADNTLAPFATEILTLDSTTFDGVARRLPALQGVPNGDKALLPGKLAALFDVRTQQWRKIRYVDDPHQNDKVVARDMLIDVPKGSLIIADLGYFGFAWFDTLIDREYHFVSRLRHKTTYTVEHTFYKQGDTFDGIVFLGAYRADRMAHPVRLVTFRIGDTLFQYVTSVLDPVVFPIADIARVYMRRWDIELAFKMIKTHLGLHLLWSAKTVVILQQTYAVLIIAQILHGLQVEIAALAGVDTFDVSLPLMVQYLPQFAYAGRDPVAFFLEHGKELRLIRPSSRTLNRAPVIPANALAPLPRGLLSTRTPRYANKDCASRGKTLN